MNESKDKNYIFIFSGPSGVGKDTVANELRKNKSLKLELVISATTRKPRPKEIDGVNYYFKTVDEFKEMIKNNEFIEYVDYNGKFYGTPKSEFKRIIDLKKNVLLIIDVVGKEKIVREYDNEYNIVSFFLMPPSLDELKKRLLNRSTNTNDDILNRIKIGKEEIKKSHKYDHIITLHSLEKEVQEISSYIKKIIN
ncbi:MAG: guanylate kinase [Mycoplasmataceae bacterium]|jgi:guanylate kinase|nr:guanylate kinase [Mycoplasmataceae bacterium]